MIVLVGGDGFLGRHITHMASARGLDVLVVSRACQDGLRLPGVRHAHANDLQSGTLNEDLIAASMVVYLASASVPVSNTEQPDQELFANVQPVMRTASLLAILGSKAKFIYFSSGGTVYGRGHTQPIPETAQIAPISPYGLGKAQAELAIEYLGRVSALRYAVLRLGNPVGRWQQSQRQGLLGIALRCLAERKPLQLFGDGHNLRDYFDADDAAELVLKLNAWTFKESGTWNVGSGVGTGELELLEKVQSITGKKLEIQRLPPRAVDLRYAVLDVRKAARDFNWSSQTHLHDTIGEIVRQTTRT